MTEVEQNIDGQLFKSENFSKKNLEKQSFINCSFSSCDLSGADFSSATEYEIDPRTNKIKKAKFSFPDVAGLLRAFDIIII